LKTQLVETEEEKEDLVAHLERCLKEERGSVKELEDRLYGIIEVSKKELKIARHTVSKNSVDMLGKKGRSCKLRT